MRTALSFAAIAVLIACSSGAAQEVPKPPEKPPETKPADAKPTESKPAEAKPAVAADPATMAAPKPGDVKKAMSEVDPSTYVLGAKDQISVQVIGGPEFSGTHLIRPDGRITVTLIGEVMAAGLSPEQLATTLKEKIGKYMVDPDITVGVLQVNSKRFFIQGEVNKPGEYPLLVPTKVLEALVNAGGFRDFANKKDIIIIREENGVTTRKHFNYNEVIKGKKLDQNVFLTQGDIIIVR